MGVFLDMDKEEWPMREVKENVQVMADWSLQDEIEDFYLALMRQEYMGKEK